MTAVSCNFFCAHQLNAMLQNCVLPGFTLFSFAQISQKKKCVLSIFTLF